MKKELTSEECRHLNERIKRDFTFPGHIMESSRVDLIDSEFISVDGQPMWFYYDRNMLAPTLQNLMNHNFLKNIKVSKGAVHYIELGHNIQRAIIKEIDENIAQNELVAIKTELWDRPIAIGLALFSAQDIMAKESGDVIRTLHHVGDKIWEYRHVI